MPSTTQQEVAALSVAVEALKQSAPEREHQLVVYTPKRLVRGVDEAGVFYRIIDGPEMTFIPSHASQCPARIKPLGDLRGLDALQSFCSRGSAWSEKNGKLTVGANDAALWGEALAYSSSTRLAPNELLTLSRSLNVACLCRRGVLVSPKELP